jgi:TetR/AcrR family transcriptional repressor of nem operon
MDVQPPPRTDARTRLLDAAMTLLRTRGYAATTVDDICAAAGVTKGAFFHHFRSKEDLGIAAAAHFSTWLEALFARSGWRDHADPLDRVLAYVDFRIAIFRGTIPHMTCLLGMMVQEIFATHPALLAACRTGITIHAAPLRDEIASAMQARGLTGFTAESLALHAMAVIQGAFVLAKADGGPDRAVDSLHHLRRYVELLFAAPQRQEGTVA